MAIKYDSSALSSLKSKLSAIVESDESNILNKVADAIASDLRDRAEQEYASSEISSPITVSSSLVGDGKARVLAEGKEVGYTEFGTGEYARGTYPGKLPVDGVPITGAWEYYYDSPYKRAAKSGDLGWYYGGHFVTGRPAGAQLWRSSSETRKMVESIARRIIEAELKGWGI